MTQRDLLKRADGYEAQTGRQWNQQLGPSSALFDAGIAALNDTGNPMDKTAVADAMKTLKVETPLGTLEWGKDPVPNVVAAPIIDSQWTRLP